MRIIVMVASGLVLAGCAPPLKFEGQMADGRAFSGSLGSGELMMTTRDGLSCSGPVSFEICGHRIRPPDLHKWSNRLVHFYFEWGQRI